MCIHDVYSYSSNCIDTIPGRQCMTSFLFLRKEFENALVYLTSVKVIVMHVQVVVLLHIIEFQGFFFNDDTFNFNFAQAKASVGQYQEAQEVINQLIYK